MMGLLNWRQLLAQYCLLKKIFSTWKKTALLKPMYYEGVHGGRNGADHTAAAGSILSAVFL
jgi:hypothetical protein